MLKAELPRPYFPGRAGSYSPTKEGWRAFHPKPLPPDPPLQLNPELLGLLATASTELGRLDGAAEILPDPDFFVYSYIRKEAVLSSQIEGTHSTLIDLLDYEAGAERPAYPRDVREVANYVRALNKALERVKAGEPISAGLIQETHKLLLNRVRGEEEEPGRLKSHQNWIGPPGSSPATAEYVPPPPEDTPGALRALMEYVQSDSPEAPLLKGGLAHSQFETIHPFLDGNGRIGRLLVTLLLTKCGALRRPVLYLSYYFLKNRAEYARRLQRVRDDGDWEGWIEFFLRGVRETSVEAAATARAILALRVEHESLIDGALGKRGGAGHKLLARLFHQPVISVNDVTKVIGTTYPPANALVERFVEMRLLVEVTGQKRNRYFRYQPYIEVLQRDRSPARPAGDKG
ncbi:MAG: Fic family protein [Thermoplasmata archaeon]|nr:Fic family protein [Thermoplasmata archaeon]